MNDEAKYKEYYNKRYEIDPVYRKAVFACVDKCGIIQMETGITIKSVRSGGLLIEYKRPNGVKLSSLVFSKDQYTMEYYKLTQLAYLDNPSCKPVVKEAPKRNFIEEEVKVD